MSTQKGQIALPVFTVVGGAIALFIGIWVISIMSGNIALPTVPNYVVNESINFVVNNTYYSFANQATCLNDVPLPPNCGVTAVSYVGNVSFTYGATKYASTTSQIKLTTDVAGQVVGVYNVSYTWYDYSSTQSGNALESTKSVTYNAFTLLGVGLIIIAASVIIGYFGMTGRKQ